MISSEDLENKIDQLNKLIEIQENEGEDTREVKESVDLTKCVLTGADAVTPIPIFAEKLYKHKCQRRGFTNKSSV